jgi:DNA repair protein RadD
LSDSRFAVGLSATPWAKGLGKIYDDLIRPVSIRELIEQGYLSPSRAFAPTRPDLAGVRTTAGDFNEGDLSQAVDKSELVANIVDTWLEKGGNRLTLCYGADCRHAQHIRERFAEAGISAGYLDHKTPPRERERIFGEFKSGKVRIICSVATIDVGVDLPCVECISDCRPTKSGMRFVQTIGRGLRVSKGKKFLTVLDHAGNHHRFGRVTEVKMYFDTLDSGEGKKASEKVGSEASAIVVICPSCHYVLPPKTQTCTECGAAISAARELIRERDGVLIELDHSSVDDRQAKINFMAMLRGYGRMRNYAKADGFAAHQFLAKFGHWPNDPEVRNAQPMEPDREICRWIKQRQIAYYDGLREAEYRSSSCAEGVGGQR